MGSEATTQPDDGNILLVLIPSPTCSTHSAHNSQTMVKSVGARYTSQFEKFINKL
jgi:hypothetical protein